MNAKYCLFGAISLYISIMLTRENFKKAPSHPGIYFFLDKTGKILYVGKAINLKLRLLSYADARNLGWGKDKMLEEAKYIEWQELESEVEALIEEAIAIKRHRPKYNVVFRDDKQYFLAGFSKDKYPRIILTHQKKAGFRHIGPFTEGNALKNVLRSLQKPFPFCTCKEKHKRPCVRAEIGRCLGVCCVRAEYRDNFFTDISEREKKYKKNIRAIQNILHGRKQDVIKRLDAEMKKYSHTQRFEDAKRIRDQLFALENIFKHAPVIRRELNPERQKALTLVQDLLGLKDIPRRIEGYDISNIQGTNAVGSMVVFESGEPKKADYRLFKIRNKKTPDDYAMHQEVLMRRLKHDEWPLPDLILIDGGIGQLNAAKKILEMYQLNIPIAGLAKREEELWISENKKFSLKKLSPLLLHLFQHIRDESHRFAINFHRKRRSITMLPNSVKTLPLRPNIISSEAGILQKRQE